MRVLLTSDLHLNIPARCSYRGTLGVEQFAAALREQRPDAVVIAGDVGTAEHARHWMRQLRDAVGDCTLAVCLGNHDLWLPPEQHHRHPTLASVVQDYWRLACSEVEAILLDETNADLGEVVVVGGYGHYDLGLASPDLHIGGTRITREIYLEGGFGSLFWNDFRLIPHCAERLDEEALAQAAGLRHRLAEAAADDRRILVATHTLPWRGLNGHPLDGSESDILAAYSGNSLVGQVMEQFAGCVDLLVCGHTHVKVIEREMAGLPRCLNLGGDYGLFRGVVFDTRSLSITWLEG